MRWRRCCTTSTRSGCAARSPEHFGGTATCNAAWALGSRPRLRSGRAPPLTTAQVPCECPASNTPSKVCYQIVNRMEDKSCWSAVKIPETASITAEWSRSTRRNSTLDCVVRNFSQRGAKIEFENSAMLPDQVDFEIARRGLSCLARLVWRDRNAAGPGVLQCARDASDAVIPLDWARKLRATERAQPATAVAPRSVSCPSI